VLDAGAEEVNDEGETFEIVTDPSDMVAARVALQIESISRKIKFNLTIASLLLNVRLQVPESDGAARRGHRKNLARRSLEYHWTLVLPRGREA